MDPNWSDTGKGMEAKAEPSTEAAREPRTLDEEVKEMEEHGYVHIPALLRKAAKYFGH